jgi:methyl-accepting chemotaxis protein
MDIDGVTQQNAALVEKAAAAAQSLQDLASHLEQVVAAFALMGGATAEMATGVTADAPATVAPFRHAGAQLRIVQGKQGSMLP